MDRKYVAAVFVAQPPASGKTQYAGSQNVGAAFSRRQDAKIPGDGAPKSFESGNRAGARRNRDPVLLQERRELGKAALSASGKAATRLAR